MNDRRYNSDVRAMANHASVMSVEGLKDSILEDWKNPQWPAMLFDAMNLALEKKMGKRAYKVWFDSLPIDGGNK